MDVLLRNPTKKFHFYISPFAKIFPFKAALKPKTFNLSICLSQAIF